MQALLLKSSLILHTLFQHLFSMKLLVVAVFAVLLVATYAKPSEVWWDGHGAVDHGATVVGPSGSIHVGPSSAGAVIPAAGWVGPGVWGHGVWGPWGHDAWGHHGLWW